MNKHLVFVSYELYPINSGGCGVFVNNAVNELLTLFQEIEVTLVLDMAISEVRKFEEIYKPHIAGNERLRCVCVSEVLSNINLDISFENLNNIYLWKSYQFFKVLDFVNNNIKHIDYIEFFDYVGIGFYAIRAQKYEKYFGKCLTAVRAHCTIDLMDIEQKQNDFNEEKIVMYQMEKMALQDCDVLLSPSKAWANLYCNRYALNNKSMLISPPPLKVKDIPLYSINSGQTDVLFYGRIFELKGVDIFVDAAIDYLLKNIESSTKFYIVGYSSNIASGKSYSQYLIEKIPLKLRNRFIFTGLLDRRALNEVLESVAVAVFPNYVESFCYSIHEIYQAGIPIICRSIAAFNDYFLDKKNCMYFNGTSSDLANKIQLLLDDYEKRKMLSYPYEVLNTKLFEESYTDVIQGEKKDVELVTDNQVIQLSLILIDYSKNKKNLSENWNLDLVSSTKSYRLVPFQENNEENNVVIWLFGYKWTVYSLFEKSFDSTMPLTGHIWIGYLDDQLDEKFFENAINCFYSSEKLQFVTSYMINIEKRSKYCIQQDIKSYNIYEDNIHGLRILYLNQDNLNIRDFFDKRLENLEMRTKLYNGYVIPEFLIKVVNNGKVKIRPEILTLFVHQSTRNGEWHPYKLYPLLEKYYSNNDKKVIRSIYHKINVYANSKDGFVGKMLKIIIKIGYKLLKK